MTTGPKSPRLAPQRTQRGTWGTLGEVVFHPSSPTTGALGTPALLLACTLVFAAFLAAQAPSAGQSSPGQSVGQSLGKSDAALPDAPQPSQDQPIPDQPREEQDNRGSGDPAPASKPANAAAPHNPDADVKPEQSSSSEQARGDISPPKEDELAHPYGDDAAPDGSGTVPGAHEWNPLRAMKDVEVGTFYYKQGNYRAAISRFREALEFKPRDAVATFKLAQSLEKSGELTEARAQYEAYLAILKDGPDSDEARKALERLKQK